MLSEKLILLYNGVEKMKKAFITGTTGQDGSYLAELLLSKDYEVHGLVRRTSHFNRQNIDHIKDKRFKLYYGDMGDTGSLCHIIKKIQPDEVYHLASMSHVQISNDIPEDTYDTNGMGTVRLLEAIRLADINPCIYNAATSELFGGGHQNELLNEKSPMHPRSPYAIAKLEAYWFMNYYRDAYGMKTWNGILFNHESPRRSENFITRKIALNIARILAHKQDKIILGNINARRDWGYAPDYVNAMYLMLQSNKPDNYVIATGVSHSIQDFLETAFKYVNISNWEDYVTISDLYKRPVDVDCLCGDSSKAQKALGWKHTVGFDELVKIMMDADLKQEGIHGY